MSSVFAGTVDDVTPVQCRMARAALGWGVRDLAYKADVAVATVTRFESGTAMRESSVARLVSTFESEGIEFIDGDAPGVRLRRTGDAHD